MYFDEKLHTEVQAKTILPAYPEYFNTIVQVVLFIGSSKIKKVVRSKYKARSTDLTRLPKPIYMGLSPASSHFTSGSGGT
jgi:hypothetical protein